MSDDSHTDRQRLSGCHEAPVVRGGSDTYYICTHCGNVCELAKLPEKQSPKDNQIDEILANFYNDIAGNVEGVMREYHQMEFLEARRALATAIREATPDRRRGNKQYGGGSMNEYFETKGYNQAIDRFLASLKDIGLAV